MTPARLRRLKADQDRVSAIFAQHPYIKIVAAEGNPPDRYTFEFKIQSLVPTTGENFGVGHAHRAEVFLPNAEGLDLHHLRNAVAPLVGGHPLGERIAVQHDVRVRADQPVLDFHGSLPERHAERSIRALVPI